MGCMCGHGLEFSLAMVGRKRQRQSTVYTVCGDSTWSTAVNCFLAALYIYMSLAMKTDAVYILFLLCDEQIIFFSVCIFLFHSWECLFCFFVFRMPLQRCAVMILSFITVLVGTLTVSSWGTDTAIWIQWYFVRSPQEWVGSSFFEQ